MHSELVTAVSRQSEELTPILCWTRMQAEAGQSLEAIIGRKELERQAGDGFFCWGVGNAPATTIERLAKSRTEVDLVFSIMKSRPRPEDIAPKRVVAWRRYIDREGASCELPNHVLVTSRFDAASGQKRAHYALMCESSAQLKLGDLGPFDPSAYRNVGESAGRVGASQVTALLRRVSSHGPMSDYRINLKARLVKSYWVKLEDPVILRAAERTKLNWATSNVHQLTSCTWRQVAADIRGEMSVRASGDQLLLF
jgi:hypothetical protein